MKHNIGRIVLMGFLLLTLLVLQWDGTALLPGTGTRIVYAQETYSKTGSDEVYPKEGIPKQHGPVIVPQQELFSSEPEQGEETLVIESSSSDVRTSVLKAPAEGSNGSMTVKIKWLDYDGTEIAPDSTSLPYRVALTLQKMTGNDASTARDVSAAEYGNNLTRNASRGSWTVSWSDLPYREGENYTVRVAPSEDYEFVTEVQAWNLSGDTAIWDTNLVLQLKEPEEIWVENTIVFNANGGKGSMKSIEAKNGKARLPKNTFTRSKSIFNGWNTKKDGSGTSYKDGAEIRGIKEGITLYAQWTSISLKMAKVKTIKKGKALMLKATLKLNGKAAKGKKITFLFKGKKYTKKTNAKGVAKLKIKKSVTKKLKKGKKVTIKATFGNATVKKTAKVK